MVLPRISLQQHFARPDMHLCCLLMTKLACIAVSFRWLRLASLCGAGAGRESVQCQGIA